MDTQTSDDKRSNPEYVNGNRDEKHEYQDLQFHRDPETSSGVSYKILISVAMVTFIIGAAVAGGAGWYLGSRESDDSNMRTEVNNSGGEGCKVWTLDQDFTKVEGIPKFNLILNDCYKSCIEVPVCVAAEYHYYESYYRCFHHTHQNFNLGPTDQYFNLTDNTGRALFKLDRDCLNQQDSVTQTISIG